MSNHRNVTQNGLSVPRGVPTVSLARASGSWSELKRLENGTHATRQAGLPVRSRDVGSSTSYHAGSLERQHTRSRSGTETASMTSDGTAESESGYAEVLQRSHKRRIAPLEREAWEPSHEGAVYDNNGYQTLARIPHYIAGAFSDPRPSRSNGKSSSTLVESEGHHRRSAVDIIHRLRDQGLSKGYWMADDSCKECSDCQSLFTTFRRKHHCRICGQIFCNACANHLVNGDRWGHVHGNIRICNLCYDVIQKLDQDEDESSKRHASHPSISVPSTMPLAKDRSSLCDSSTLLRNHPFYAENVPSPNPSENDAQEQTSETLRQLQTDELALGNEMPSSPTKAVPFRGEALGDLQTPVDDLSETNWILEEPPRPPDVSQGSARSHDLVKCDTEGTDSTIPVPRPSSAVENEDRPDFSKLVGTPNVGHRDRSALGLDVELNTTSIQYLKRMLAQLLSRINIARPEIWEQQILFLLLEISCKVLPDVRAGDAIDIRHYVKMKRIAGGSPKDCEYVDGMIFAQNTVHRKMNRSINAPRILLLAFALEYQRVEDKFMSLEAISSQEHEYLSKVVSRISALRPHIVMTSRSISRVAIDMLLEAQITAFRGVKLSVLQAISRCTQADIVPSIDRLALHPKLGRCGSFQMRTFQYDFAMSGKRSYAFIEACPPNLGASILLRGDSLANLKQVKTVVDFMTAVVYHLKLESLLMRDQFAMIRINPPVARTLLDEFPSYPTETSAALNVPSGEGMLRIRGLLDRVRTASSLSMTEDMTVALKDHEYLSTLLLSCSPSVERQLPKLLLEVTQHIDLWVRSFDSQELALDSVLLHSVATSSRAEELRGLLDDWIHFRAAYLSTTAMDHQSLVVLHSRRSMLTYRPCAPPITDMVAFYGKSDKSLGQFLEDNYRNAKTPCPVAECERPMMMHYLHYVHDRAALTVLTEEQPCPLPDMENVILMWSYCKLCGKATPITPMSEDAWRFSFGKYLELSLYDTRIRPRADICPHLLYRDHVRFFALRNLTARFQSNEIKPWRIALPLKHLFVDPAPHLALLKQELGLVRQRTNKYWLSLQMRLDSYDGAIQSGNFASIGVSDLKLAKESALGNAKECTDTLDILQTMHSASALRQGLIRARRSLQDLVVVWDVRLTAFERLILPQDSEAHKLSSSQIKRFFGGLDPAEGHGAYSGFSIREKRSTHERSGDEEYALGSKPVDNSHMSSTDESDRHRLPIVQEAEEPVTADNVDLIDRTLSSALHSVAIVGGSEDEHGSKASSLAYEDMPGTYLTNSSIARRSRHNYAPDAQVRVFDNMTEAVKEESDPDSGTDDEEELTYLKFAASHRWQRQHTDLDHVANKTDVSSQGRGDDAKNLSGLSKLTQNLEHGPPAQALDALLMSDRASVIERPSLLKSISNLWPFKLTGFSPLDYPLSPQEHLFTRSVILVRDDEPSSILAFTLSSEEYRERLDRLHENSWSRWLLTQNRARSQAYETPDLQDGAWQEYVLKKPATLHIRSQFQDATSKIACKVFFAEQFSALRKACRCEDSVIGSLSRCIKWESTGGKSGSTFLKSQDDRLIMKELSKPEMDAFTRFAPAYFEYMTKAFFHGLPTVLAKIFGFFRVSCRNLLTGKSFKLDVLVMENLFFGRKLSKIYDLKGSIRNRHVTSTGKENEVLLDENLIETMFQSPLYVDNYAKKTLRASLWNDTLFLSKANVMDYSLVVGLDEDSNQAVVGIVDFIRTYTWDKKLESWVKENTLLGGGRGEPTIVTPKSYKIRFREAMERYFVLVPDCWTKVEDVAPWQPEAPIPIARSSSTTVL